MPARGERQAYRPMPPDFAEVYERVGWEFIMDECRAGRATVRRWIGEFNARASAAGEPLLHERRRRWLEQHYAATMPGRKIRGWTPGRPRARRYVLGRVLTPIIDLSSDQ